MIKFLAMMIPKYNELEKPPILPSELVDDLKMYCSNICFLLKKYDDGARYAIEETVKIVEKLTPFLLFKNDRNLQDAVANALYKICKLDDWSREYFCKYLENCGEVKHPLLNNTLNSEVSRISKLALLSAK